MIMSKYTKYKLYQKYETRGSQEAIPCYPNVFSIDGDGTMPLVIVEENSRDCGYTGETQPIYRWYTLPIDTYYYCDACQDAQYKWVNLPISQDWECVGTTKYYKQKKQVSVDGGSTWTDVTPPQYQRGALYEYSSQSCGYRTRTSSGSPYCEGYDKYVDVYSQYSTDGGNTWQTTATTPTMVEHNSAYCGYVPPSPKLQASYNNGTSYSAACNDSTELTRSEVWASGYQYSAMTSAIVGDCVTTIGFGAFGECKSLTSVTIPYSVTEIDADAFVMCYSLTNISIPNSVTKVGGCGILRSCTGLTSFYLPSSVTAVTVCNDDNSKNIIGSSMYSLSSITVDNSNPVFDSRNNCNAIIETSTNSLISGCKNTVIPNTVTSIGPEAFQSCRSLTSIDIPNSVTSIGRDAFYQCSSLTSIDIPSGVTYIGLWAFNGCSGLTSITVNATTPPTLGHNVYGYRIFDDTGDCPIYVDCSLVNNYKSATGWSEYASRIRPKPNTCAAMYRWVESGWTCVGYDKYVNNIQQVSYDSGYTWENTSNTSASTLIEADSSDCGYIEPQYRTTSGDPYCTGYDKYVDVYSQVSYDGGSTWRTTATTPTLVEASSIDCGTPLKLNARYNGGTNYYKVCDSNTTLTSGETRPNGYTYTAMTSAEVGDCVTTIGGRAFNYFTSLTSINIPNSVTSIGDWAFEYCSGLTSIDIPSGVTTISDGTFSDCSSLTSIDIPSGVTSIGDYAFYSCISLTSVTIPNSVTSIGTRVFEDCNGLTSVTIPNSVSSIGTQAFQLCSGLASVNIGNSVTSIGYGAFAYCSGLTSITCLATTPPTLGSYVFSYTNDWTIYVPAESVEAYKTAWSDYASRIQAIP